MKPKSLSERQRVQLRERFNALWKQNYRRILRSIILNGRWTVTWPKLRAGWFFLAHVQTSRSTPEKRRRAMEAGCVEGNEMSEREFYQSASLS